MKKIILISLFIMSPVFSAQYSVIIDGAKTSSSIHLFVSDSAKPLPNIQDIWDEKNNIGLASFVDHPNDAAQSLEPLLNDAIKVLNEKNISVNQVTLELYGTDGMRLIPPPKQKLIYENIRNYLQTNYVFILEKIQTLSGERQGLYEWLDINYLTGRLISNDLLYSILHVGDAALQVVFSSDELTQDFFRLVINKKEFKIFSKNFSALGEDQMILKMHQNKDFENCYQTNKFQLSVCLKIFDNLLQSEKFPETHKEQFVANDRTEEVYDFFGVEDASQGSLESRINAICSMSWEEMKAEYADSNIPEDKLRNLCANGVYLDALFYRKMNLDWSQLWVTDRTRDGHKIDWTLGALLYKIIYLKK